MDGVRNNEKTAAYVQRDTSPGPSEAPYAVASLRVVRAGRTSATRGDAGLQQRGPVGLGLKSSWITSRKRELHWN